MRYCEASLVHFGAIELCKNERFVGLLSAEITPSLTRTKRIPPDFIPPIWQYHTSGDTLSLDINRAPVTNREGISLDGFQRPPDVDNQHSASEETLALPRVWKNRLQIVQCATDREIRVHTVRRGAVSSEQGSIFCEASNPMRECDCPGSAGSGALFSFSNHETDIFILGLVLTYCELMIPSPG